MVASGASWGYGSRKGLFAWVDSVLGQVLEKKSFWSACLDDINAV